jgi:hypothetical protein
MIEDRRIASAFAIEALRIFDHLHFRSKMQDSGKAQKAGAKVAKEFELKLQKPKAISGAKRNWFETAYLPASQKEKDRKLFSAAEVH